MTALPERSIRLGRDSVSRFTFRIAILTLSDSARGTPVSTALESAFGPKWRFAAMQQNVGMCMSLFLARPGSAGHRPGSPVIRVERKTFAWSELFRV
jgi:hypothetical protein